MGVHVCVCVCNLVKFISELKLDTVTLTYLMPVSQGGGGKMTTIF